MLIYYLIVDFNSFFQMGYSCILSLITISSSCPVMSMFISGILCHLWYSVSITLLTSFISSSLCSLPFYILSIRISMFGPRIFLSLIITDGQAFHTNYLAMPSLFGFLFFLILVKVNRSQEVIFVEIHNLLLNQFFIHHQIIVFDLLLMLFWCSFYKAFQNYHGYDLTIGSSAFLFWEEGGDFV